MLGFLLSFVLFFVPVGPVWDRRIHELGGPLEVALLALVVVAIGWVAGLVFARTVGSLYPQAAARLIKAVSERFLMTAATAGLCTSASDYRSALRLPICHPDTGYS